MIFGRTGEDESFVRFFFVDVCGPMATVAILLTAVLLLAGACVVLKKVKRVGPIASLLPLTLLPLTFGLSATFYHMINVFSVILITHVKTDPGEMVAVIGLMIGPTFLGLIASAPAFLVTAIGLLLVSFKNPNNLL